VASAKCFRLRQQGTLRFMIADFSPCERKIGSHEHDGYRSAEG
jgi:hypothetical protein